ncbi:MAG: AhpC/TSA family protein [Bacteroidales bacterium]|jgi:peroxiredoxin|nr:TlpA disulfide reductase family protein [Bacteroidales bacterium]NLK79260.1 AhpC/TSA family protein [Bacteroidales bacterium]HKM31917.1 TlpA disulfide reductase family protein [Bacteroidales bacterium]HPX79191.1 TlpA disulfide reductase family protein [Bacteroidales bacterium]
MRFNILVTTAVMLSTALFFSCKTDHEVRISGTVENLQEDDVLLFKRLDFSSETLLDTIRRDGNGNFKYTLKKGVEQPGYYYLYAGDRKAAALILKKGDKINLQTTRDGKVSRLEGSEESLLLQQVNADYHKMVRKFDSLYVQYEKASGKEKERLSIELGTVFVKYKQSAIRFLYQHPRAFVNTSVIFHTFPGQLYVFADPKDAPLLRRIYDSLYLDYPLSPHTMAVRDRYENMEKALRMEHAFSQVEVTDFPDICLPGVGGKIACLSELKGKTILLSFWHSANVRMRFDNRELQDLYRQYAPKGLEIFQVALDTDKAAWATAIRDQSLLWVSVCDGMGVYSPAVTSYNVVEIPTYFIINRNGDIVSRESNVDAAIKQIKRLF